MNVFLIGAQKSGTTTLAGLLDQHPDICLTAPKETNYFSSNYHKGQDWYLGCFPDQSAQVRLDASPSYTMASLSQLEHSSSGSSVPEKIQAYDANAKFIYVLRSHVDRVYSAYWHNVRGGYEPLEFRQAFLDSDEYLAPTLYCKQLDLFLEFFPRSQFLILKFEDLADHPATAVQQCTDFIGLAAYSHLTIGSPKNRSFQYTPFGQVIRSLAGSRTRMKAFTKLAKTIVPARHWEKFKSVASRPIPQIDDEDRRWLEPFFAEDQERLKRDFGIDSES